MAKKLDKWPSKISTTKKPSWSLPTPKVSAGPHVIVQALAGTGKTTTLIEGLKRIRGITTNIEPSPQQLAVWEAMESSKDAESICMVAFNKSIATELQNRVPPGCSAMTMHSMGFKAVTKAFGRVKVSSWRVQDIIAEIMQMDIREIRKKQFMTLKATEQLVGLCKVNLVEGSDEDDLDEIAGHYEVDVNGNRSEVYDLVPKVLERCKDVSRDNQIDFNDMIWLPTALDLSVFKYDLLLVDEAQDLNRCQQELAKKAGTRLVFCGDVHQAIYGFAGADAKSMERLQQDLEATDVGCVCLPLTVTRRCGKAIVAEAQKIVSEFEAHEGNPEGKISQAKYKGDAGTLYDYDKDTKCSQCGAKTSHVPCPECGYADPYPEASYLGTIQGGDMAICRVNAPLVSQCFKLLKAGRRANIQGRDVGQGLISTIRKQKASDAAELTEKLSDWIAKELEKENRKRTPNENRLISLQDRYDCLLCFIEGETTVDEVIKKIENVFTDDKNNSGTVMFSSIHKAKGLEAKRVFLLEPEGGTVPHPMAKSAWQIGQEWNLRYVAITRAIEELVYVT